MMLQDIAIIVAGLQAQVASLRARLDETKDPPVETPPGFIHPGIEAFWPGELATVPDGWLPEDGRALEAADYPGLFAAIGYAYGGSDGTFNIPLVEKRAFVAFKSGDATYGTVGANVGAETHSHDATVPDHSHLVTTNSYQFCQDNPGNSALTSVGIDGAGELSVSVDDAEHIPPSTVRIPIIKV